MTELEKEVWQAIQKINRAWTTNVDEEVLKTYFHKSMVAITATDQNRLEGGESCVAGWMHFSKNATINSWVERDPKIELYGEGKFAIATYYFDLSFEMNGELIEMKGRDMFSLIKENEKWLVVANQFSSFPYPS